MKIIEIKIDEKRSIRNCLNLRAKKIEGKTLTQEEMEILNEFEKNENNLKNIKIPFLDVINRFNENFKLFIELHKIALYEGAKTGYFPPMSMSASETSDGDKILSFLKENYNDIKSELLNYFKNKLQENALIESLELFETGKYRGAITVMLPIIDSIFYDRNNQDSSFEIFSNKISNKSKRENNFESKIKSDSIKQIMLSIHEFDISKSIQPYDCSDEDWTLYTELIESGKMINRHLILHGKVFDYGNENNFFRTFSLLNFLIELEIY